MVPVVVLLLGAGLGTPAPAAGAPPTLFVDNTGSVPCSDSGTGTQAQPFCTVQAAVDVVNPGQTISIVGGHSEAVTITRSGTAGAPIVLEAGPNPNGGQILIGSPDIGSALTVRGAHDVTIRNLGFSGMTNTIDVDDSTDVVVDSNEISATSGSSIGVTNGSSSVSLTRNQMLTAHGPVIRVDAGGNDDTIANNVISGAADVGISVAGTPHTAITGNTVLRPCYQGISVSGGSAGTTVENNIVQFVFGSDNEPFVCPNGPTIGDIVVDSAAVASGVTDDYNIDFPVTSTPGYVWAGTAYGTSSAFTTATGQGAHDLDVDPQVSFSGFPSEGSPAIDSANADAPGELSTDANNQPRRNDPLVPDTGAGARTFDDRGAFEMQDSFTQQNLTVSATQAPVGGEITVSGALGDAWSEAFTCAIDFGDGVQTSVSPCTTTHAYARTGTYQITTVASNPAGLTVSSHNTIKVVPAGGSLMPQLRLANSEANGVQATVTGGSDPWNLTGATWDFGDGVVTVPGAPTSIYHGYQKPGTYTVTVTVTDANGATASTTASITTDGTAFTPYGPVRLLDTATGLGGSAIPPHGTLRLRIGGNGAIPANAAAAALNMTVRNPTAKGFLEVYTDGTRRPVASSLNFVPHQTVSNMTIATVGRDGFVDVYNGSGGSVDVAADVYGYFTTGAGDSYQALLVDRLLDTRTGTGGPLAGGSAAHVVIAGAATDNGHVPTTGVTAAVLNVTAINPAAAGTVTAFPDGAAPPNTPNLNYAAGQTTSNTMIVPLASDGSIELSTSATTDLTADLVGFFSVDSFRSYYVPIRAVRTVDTRKGIGETAPAPVPGNTVQGFQIDHGIPPLSTNYAAIVVNATVTNTTGPGALTIFEPTGAPPPTAANQSWVAGQTVANLSIAQASSNLNGLPPESFFNSGATPVDVIVDVFGYFAFTPGFK